MAYLNVTITKSTLIIELRISNVMIECKFFSGIAFVTFLGRMNGWVVTNYFVVRDIIERPCVYDFIKTCASFVPL